MNVITNKMLFQRIQKMPSLSARITSRRYVNFGIEVLNNAGPQPSTSRAVASETNEMQHTTVTENSTSEPKSCEHNVIVAITEGRGNAQGEVGIAAIDLNSPCLQLTQFSDNTWYGDCIAKLEILEATEILIPMTIYNAPSILLDSIRSAFSRVKITALPRRHFNEMDGLEMLQKFISPECKNLLGGLSRRYYAMLAVSALIKYLEATYNVRFENNSLVIQHHTRYGRMLLGHESSCRLELLYPLCETTERKASLYGVLDNTITAAGKRCLRAAILEPYCNIASIKSIQEGVKELVENIDFMSNLEKGIFEVKEIDKVLRLSITYTETFDIKVVEKMLNQILLLKSCLQALPDLANTIRTARTNYFKNTISVLTDKRFADTLKEIERVIQPEVQNTRGSAQFFQRIFAVRPDINEMLDLSRDVYKQLVEEIRRIIQDITTECGLPLKMIHTSSKGFHIQLIRSKNSLNHVIPTYLEVIYKKGYTFYLTNIELSKLNIRVIEVIKTIHQQSEITIRVLIGKLIENIYVIFMLVGTIAQLDLVLSFAKVSARDGYCCPNFADETRIIGAVHPLLEYSRMKPEAIPNNVIGTPEYNYYVITGPNMGGKTIYLKTIALLQIMAQIGCFVPAKYATIRLCDFLFTRIGYEDNIEQNISNFTLEMREMQYILKSITANSLILIDELCRSTNPTEGKEIAWKLCKRLVDLKGPKNKGIYFEEDKTAQMDNTTIDLNTTIENTKLKNITSPFIYITTHFSELTKLCKLHENVVNLHLSADAKYVDDKLQLTFNHRVMQGVNPIRGYGMSLARRIRFPCGVVGRAEEIFQEIHVPHLMNLSSIDTPHQSEFRKEMEKSINDRTFTVTSALQNMTLNCVTSFMNNSSTQDISTTQHSTFITMSSSALLQDFEEKLYDIYSNIAAISRSKNLSAPLVDLDINDMFQKLADSLPPTFLAALICTNATDTTIPETLRTAKASSDVHNQTATGMTRLTDLSLQSLIRRNALDNLVIPTSSTRIASGYVSFRSPVAGPSKTDNRQSERSACHANITAPKLKPTKKIKIIKKIIRVPQTSKFGKSLIVTTRNGKKKLIRRANVSCSVNSESNSLGDVQIQENVSNQENTSSTH